MFRNLPVFDLSDDPTKLDGELEALAAKMIKDAEQDKSLDAEDEDQNADIPAGYTYLGQFIDHDVTFDPVSSLQRQNDPDGLEDFRTPRFDLDSLYGRGPADQPYLYQAVDKAKLAIGRPVEKGSGQGASDLIRFGETALIGDPRRRESDRLAAAVGVRPFPQRRRRPGPPGRGPRRQSGRAQGGPTSCPLALPVDSRP